MNGIIKRGRAQVRRRWRRRINDDPLRREAGHYTLVHNQASQQRKQDSGQEFHVATYNVHRWTGLTGGNRWRPELAQSVLSELDVDVIGLQEVLRPAHGEDPLREAADRAGLNFAFVCTRYHRRGDLGNAILSRWPISSVLAMNLSFGRLEQRSALAAVLEVGDAEVAVVATHLALLDRTRRLQVESLLKNPRLERTVVLLGDMNAWRKCPATRQLDRELTDLHHNRDWPASFPSQRPVLALDRIYARGARVDALRAHNTVAARRGSDHLPIIGQVHVTTNGLE